MNGRLLSLQAGEAAWNMAVDQTLLESCEQSGVPSLRMYQWIRPTLSLGYFQHLADRDSHEASRGVDCVRRATGGGAILHHHELTYSVAMPMPPGETRKRQSLYSKVHAVVVQVLADFGVTAVPYEFSACNMSTHDSDSQPFLCFQRRTDVDLILSGYKIMGSAQRRTRHAVLQHGSLLISASQHAPELPGIGELSGKTPDIDELSNQLEKRLSSVLEIQWVESLLTDVERKRATDVQRDRFESAKWLARR